MILWPTSAAESWRTSQAWIDAHLEDGRRSRRERKNEGLRFSQVQGSQTEEWTMDAG